MSLMYELLIINLVEFAVISLNMFRLIIILKRKMKIHKTTPKTLKEAMFSNQLIYVFFYLKYAWKLTY